MAVKYQMIYDELIKSIKLKKLKVGDQLPTEKELCERFDVSRITAMRAVKELERKGWVSRTAGHGSFVSKDIKKAKTAFHIFVPNLRRKYYLEIVTHFVDYFFNRGQRAFIFETHYHSEAIINAIQNLQESESRGLGIILSPLENKKQLEILRKVKCPFVLGSRFIKGMDTFQIIVNEAKGANLAVQHFYRMGHKRILFYGEKGGHCEQRYLGFIKALDKYKLRRSECPVIQGKEEQSHVQIKKLFKTANAPTAVITGDCHMAMMIYDLMLDIGIKSPEDVAIVALDGDILATSMEVPLTTVDFPGDKVGQEMAKVIWELDQGKVSYKKKTIRLDAKLTIRDSCGIKKGKFRHQYLQPSSLEDFNTY